MLIEEFIRSIERQMKERGLTGKEELVYADYSGWKNRTQKKTEEPKVIDNNIYIE